MYSKIHFTLYLLTAFCANSVQILHSQLPVVVGAEKLSEHPHRFNGMIYATMRKDGKYSLSEDESEPSGIVRGSGVGALHPKLVLGCAHVVCDIERESPSKGYSDYPWAKGFKWFHGRILNSAPSLDEIHNTYDMRDVICETSFASFAFSFYQQYPGGVRPTNPGPAQDNYHASSTAMVDRDFAIYWRYDATAISGSHFATIDANPTKSLTSAASQKLYTGYPVFPFIPKPTKDDIPQFRLYETDLVNLSFEPRRWLNKSSFSLQPVVFNSAFQIYGGNSGGPLWVRQDGLEYKLAAIVGYSDGTSLPLDAPIAKKIISSAQAKVGKINYPVEVESKLGYNIAPGWSDVYGLGEVLGDVDTFTINISSPGNYEIETSAALPSASIDTVGSLMGPVIVGTKHDDDSGEGKNFRFSLYLTPGKYTLRVRGSYPTLRGQYRLSVSALFGVGVPQIEVAGTAKKTPIKNYSGVSQASTTLGTHFGSITGAVPTAPTRTLSFDIRNTGGGVLSLTGTPKVVLSGLHASQFQVVSQPSLDALPARIGSNIESTSFSIRYQPNIVGNHIARVTVMSDSADDMTFQFAIRGSAPSLPSRPDGDVSHLVSASLQVNGWDVSETQTASALDYGGDADMFRFVLSQRMLCTFWTTGDTDTLGTLFLISGSKQKKLLSADHGAEWRNFSLTRVLDPGTYAVEVRGANADFTGDYRLHATQTPVSGYAVLTNTNGIPISDGSTLIDTALATDFGNVDYRKGAVEQSYILTNHGYADINLTGTPRITLTGNGVGAFTVKTQPKATILKPGAKTSFTLWYDPAFVGTYDLVVSVPITEAGLADGTYQFSVQGRSFGAVKPLAVSKRIAANAYASYYFTTTGRWYAWGNQPEVEVWDDFGYMTENFFFTQLNTPTVYAPSLESPPIAVAGGGYRIHTAARDGRLMGWGNDYAAGFGNGVKTDSDVPAYYPLAAKTGWGSEQAMQIAAGALHTLMVTNMGGVWSWGDQSEGQLGNGTIKSYASSLSHVLNKPSAITKNFSGSRIIRVAAGEKHSLALDSEGQVWSWGANNRGQLGLGGTARQSKPTKISSSAFAGERIVGIACSAFSSFAVTESGVVWSWGDNERGALGDNTFIQKTTPVMVLDAVTGQKHTFGGDQIRQIAAGSDQVFVLTESGAVWTWGECVTTTDDMAFILDASSSMLQTWTERRTTPVLHIEPALSQNDTVIELAAGGERIELDTTLPILSLSHCLFLTRSGSVLASGNNERGQVGNYSFNGQPDPVQVISAPNPGEPLVMSQITAYSEVEGNTQDGFIFDIVAQPDGKLLVSGDFNVINGIRRSNLARLHPDGSVDTSFHAKNVTNVTGMHVMEDGKILVSTTSGSGDAIGIYAPNPPYLRRYLSDGRLDSSFKFQPRSPGAGRNYEGVSDCQIQTDGKILFLGEFESTNHDEYGELVGRTNANGSSDSTFSNSLVITDGGYSSLALLPDNKFLLKGEIWLDPQTQLLSKHLPDGQFDPSWLFTLSSGDYLHGFSTLPDGHIILAGEPYNSWSGLARLNPTGQLITGLDPGPGYSAHLIQPQVDDKILVGSYDLSTPYRVLENGAMDPDFNFASSGWFNAVLGDGTMVGRGDNSVTAVYAWHNTPASEEVRVLGANRVQWLRSGSSPEVSRVSFELTTNNGKSWTRLGYGTHIIGGWELLGLSLPPSGRVRARARVNHDGSSSLIDSVCDFY